MKCFPRLARKLCCPQPAGVSAILLSPLTSHISMALGVCSLMPTSCVRCLPVLPVLMMALPKDIVHTVPAEVGTLSRIDSGSKCPLKADASSFAFLRRKASVSLHYIRVPVATSSPRTAGIVPCTQEVSFMIASREHFTSSPECCPMPCLHRCSSTSSCQASMSTSAHSVQPESNLMPGAGLGVHTWYQQADPAAMQAVHQLSQP